VHVDFQAGVCNKHASCSWLYFSCVLLLPDWSRYIQSSLS